MRRLSIARTVRIALLGLSVLLALLAGAGIARLYDVRQTYEDRIASAFALEAGAAKLLAASVVEEATLRTAHGRNAAVNRGRAAAAFNVAAAAATTAARGDPPSQTFVARAAAAQATLRAQTSGAAARAARAPILALADRQVRRRSDARERARSDSRVALTAVLIAAGLALIVVLTLVSVLIGRVRDPLAELVRAARRLAAGDLSARVPEQGPEELRRLGEAFNAMAADLARALDTLEQERARLDLTIASLSDALVVVDREGRVAAANPRARQLVPELEPGGDAADAGVLPPLGEALQEELTIEHAEQTLAVTAAQIAGGAARGSVVWTLRDVTERVRLERLKSEFVATASHELRSPLTSIKGFVELLAASERLDRREREFVDIIFVSTNRLADLVNDLLDVARVEAGEIEINARPADLEEVVREVATLLGPRVRDKRQRLELEIEPRAPRAHADPARVRQILTNLLTNAHLYSDEGGTIRVSLSGGDDDTVALEVADDGRGMSAAELERVFDRFYRGGDGAGVPGTGLGLSIVRSLVDLHGGRVEVSSAPGAGTTFRVLLPRALEVGIAPARAAALHGRRVLVIDDEPDVARLIAERLAPYGVHCEIATSGAEGIERLRAEHFDAVTLDILMPQTSGFDVLRVLRSEPELARLPVVVISVFSGREALSGAWAVSKPIDSEELADALGRAVLAGRVRLLVAGREEHHELVARALEELGIEHVWASDATEVQDLCRRYVFEAALVDASLAKPGDVIAALDLRGRRIENAVVIFAADRESQGLAKLDALPLSIEDAGSSVLSLLMQARQGERASH